MSKSLPAYKKQVYQIKKLWNSFTANFAKGFGLHCQLMLTPYS